jgi:hypothetical protein
VILLDVEQPVGREHPLSHCTLREQKDGRDGTYTFPFLPPVYSTPFQGTHHYYHIPVNRMAGRMIGGESAARRRCKGYESTKCVAVSSV